MTSMSQSHCPQCGCDPAEQTKRVEQAFSRYKEDPTHALQRACGLDGNPVDVDMLTALEVHVVRDPTLRNMAIIEAIISMLFGGWDHPRYPGERQTGLNLGWSSAVLTFNGALGSIMYARSEEKPLGSEDDLIIERLCQIAPKILQEFVWTDLNALLAQDDPEVVRRRRVIAEFLRHMAHNFGMKQQLEPDKCLAVIMHCYIATPLHDDRREDIADVVSHFFAGCPYNVVRDLDHGRTRRAIQTIGVQTFIGKLREWIMDDSLLDKDLHGEILAATAFCVQPDWCKLYIEAGIHIYLIIAMKRQRAQGRQETEFLYNSGFYILSTMMSLDHDSCLSVAEETLKFGAFGLAVDAMCLVVEEPIEPQQYAARTYTTYLRQISQKCEESFETKDLDFILSVKTEAEKWHVFTAHRLLTGKAEYKTDADELWSYFAKRFKLDEEKIAERWIAKRECWYSLCIFRDGYSGKIRGCARCKSARYCSVRCQKADWKTHKLYCCSTLQIEARPA